MSWVEETLKGINQNGGDVSKNDIKKNIREAAIALINRGYDWDDVEIFIIASLRPVVGEFIILLHKWIREVRNEEMESGVVH